MSLQPNVEYVQIDSLVVMKIVKHVDSELNAGMSEMSGESCQGLLTGLVAVEDRRLEVTNCFAMARQEPALDNDDASGGAATAAQTAANAAEEAKQAEMMDMLRKFRKMNIDYEVAGFYQSHPFGACFTQDMVDSLFDYQNSMHDGVMLVYDPIRTRQGQLSLHAYRLSQRAYELHKDGSWSPDAVKAAGLTADRLFDELPIVLKNSHLVSAMVAELALAPSVAVDNVCPHLELGTRRWLEKCVRGLSSEVDELNKSASAYGKWLIERQRHDATIYNLSHKRQIENEARAARGEPPLSMDDIRRIRPPQMMTRNGLLDGLLAALNASAMTDFCNMVTGENIAKLFLAEAAADDKSASTSAKTRDTRV